MCCLLVYDTVSKATCCVFKKAGKIKIKKNLLQRTSLCLFLSFVCARCTSQPNHGTGSQPFRQRGRRAKQIKHKPTNHRRRLISAVLKGEPEWVTIPSYKFPNDAVSYATMRTETREAKVQRETPLALFLILSSERTGAKWRSISLISISVMCKKNK